MQQRAAIDLKPQSIKALENRARTQSTRLSHQRSELDLDSRRNLNGRLDVIVAPHPINDRPDLAQQTPDLGPHIRAHG